MNLLQEAGPLLVHPEDFGTLGNIQIDIFAHIACSCDILKNRLEPARPAPSKTPEGDIDCGPKFPAAPPEILPEVPEIFPAGAAQISGGERRPFRKILQA